MNFSRKRTRTSSVFTVESGTSTFLCFALHALRIDVNRSAMGSLTDMVPFPAFGPSGLLPAGLHHPRDLPQERQLAEADAAEAEIAEEPAWPSAPVAAVVAAHFELGRPLPLFDDRLLSQPDSSGAFRAASAAGTAGS